MKKLPKDLNHNITQTLTKMKKTINQIVASNEDVKELIELYTSKKKNIIEINIGIFDQIKGCDEKIAELNKLLTSEPNTNTKDTPVTGNKMTVVGIKEDDYPLTGSFPQKIQYLLRTAPNGLTSRELVSKVMQVEKIKSNKTKKIYSNVTNALHSGFYKTSLLTRKEGKDGNFVYSNKK